MWSATALLALLAPSLVAQSPGCPALTGAPGSGGFCQDGREAARPREAQPSPGQTQARKAECDESSATGPWCKGNPMSNTTTEHLTIDSFVRELTPLADPNDQLLHVSWRCPNGVSAEGEITIEVRYLFENMKWLIRKTVKCSEGAHAAEFPHWNAELTGFQAVARLHNGNRHCPSMDFVSVSVKHPRGMQIAGFPGIASRSALAAYSTIAEYGWELKTTPDKPGRDSTGKPQPIPRNRRLRGDWTIYDFSSCPILSIEYKPRKNGPVSNLRLFY